MIDRSNSAIPMVQERSHFPCIGKPRPCPALRSISNRVRGVLQWCNSTSKYASLDAKLEKKMVEVRRGSSGRMKFRSIDSILVRFPHLKEQLKNTRDAFKQFDEDSNGTIDREVLKKCLQKLKVNLTEREIDDLFYCCDIDGSGGIQFNEFIVLLCLIYLLTKSPDSPESSPRIGSPQLEATFETIVEAFTFLDKNGDGKLNEKDVTKALNGAPREKSPKRVFKTRFKEMDKDKNGNVSFREFLFALTSWLGIDTDDEVL